MKSPISILPHEDIVLRRIAEKLGLPYKSTPGYRVFDRLRRSYIALSYVMELVNGKCIFLSREGKCIIHDIYKPLICRSFPYVPKQVRYNIIWGVKTIYATAEYGLSIECPVIREDSNYITSLLEKGSFHLSKYMEFEVKAANEMEKTRYLLLSMLSELWRKGEVDLVEDPRVKAPVLNLYDLLRKYYPNLPYLLNVDKALSKIHSVLR